MRRTEKLSLGAFAVGAVIGLAVWFYFGSGWAGFIVGALCTAGIYRTMLDQVSKETVIDSRALNDRK